MRWNNNHANTINYRALITIRNPALPSHLKELLN